MLKKKIQSQAKPMLVLWNIVKGEKYMLIFNKKFLEWLSN